MRDILPSILLENALDTTDVQETANITARNITIDADQIGVFGNYGSSFDIPLGQKLSEGELRKLQAQRGYTIYDIDKDGYTLYGHDDLDVTATGTLNVTTDSWAILGSERDLRVGEIKSGNSVILKTDGAITGGRITSGFIAEIEAAGGDIGSEANPLSVRFAGEKSTFLDRFLTSRAAGDVNLAVTADQEDNMQIGRIRAGETIRLSKKTLHGGTFGNNDGAADIAAPEIVIESGDITGLTLETRPGGSGLTLTGGRFGQLDHVKLAGIGDNFVLNRVEANSIDLKSEAHMELRDRLIAQDVALDAGRRLTLREGSRIKAEKTARLKAGTNLYMLGSFEPRQEIVDGKKVDRSVDHRARVSARDISLEAWRDINLGNLTGAGHGDGATINVLSRNGAVRATDPFSRAAEIEFANPQGTAEATVTAKNGIGEGGILTIKAPNLTLRNTGETGQIYATMLWPGVKLTLDYPNFKPRPANIISFDDIIAGESIKRAKAPVAAVIYSLFSTGDWLYQTRRRYGTKLDLSSYRPETEKVETIRVFAGQALNNVTTTIDFLPVGTDSDAETRANGYCGNLFAGGAPQMQEGGFFCSNEADIAQRYPGLWGALPATGFLGSIDDRLLHLGEVESAEASNETELHDASLFTGTSGERQTEVRGQASFSTHVDSQAYLDSSKGGLQVSESGTIAVK